MFKTIFRNLIFLVFIALAVAGLTTSGSGCASMVPPTGGPKDSLPPILLTAAPRDSALNFNSKKIIFTFDEFVEVDEVSKNLLVSPTPKNNPVVTNKLRTITVTIKDTLEPNTTYSLNFGNAVKDLNEGNVYRNFTYLFSTGRHIDSLNLSGKLVVAETGKPDSTLVVLLYKNFDDSAIIKERSRYVARVDSTGAFEFHNLEPGTFRVFAVKDEGQRRYFSKSELFAFLDSPVTSQSQRRDLMLYAYAETKEKQDTGATGSSKSKKKLDPKDRVLKIQNNLTGGQLDLLSHPELAVGSDPYKYFDSSKVHLLSEKLEPLARYRFQMDSTNKVMKILYQWKENTKYNLVLDSAFAGDTMGRQIVRQDTIAFQTKKLSEYGSLKLRFLNLDLKLNPVLVFLLDDKIVYSHIFKNSNLFNADVFQPGDYDMRIVFDTNKNGVWDTGEFFLKHRQPERVVLIKRKLNVKPNWVTEVDIQL
jgi:Bacterial Ig-like domain